MLPVSFFTVSSVVAQGEWKSTSRHTETAVAVSQPFSVSSRRNESSEDRSVSEVSPE